MPSRPISELSAPGATMSYTRMWALLTSPLTSVHVAGNSAGNARTPLQLDAPFLVTQPMVDVA
jgi:hypothetical protein